MYIYIILFIIHIYIYYIIICIICHNYIIQNGPSMGSTPSFHKPVEKGHRCTQTEWVDPSQAVRILGTPRSVLKSSI